MFVAISVSILINALKNGRKAITSALRGVMSHIKRNGADWFIDIY